MTPQEKTAKIVDLQRQIRKIRKSIKDFNIPKKRSSVNKVFSNATRFVRLCICNGVLKAKLQQIQSQPCK